MKSVKLYTGQRVTVMTTMEIDKDRPFGYQIHDLAPGLHIVGNLTWNEIVTAAGHEITQIDFAVPPGYDSNLVVWSYENNQVFGAPLEKSVIMGNFKYNVLTALVENEVLHKEVQRA